MFKRKILFFILAGILGALSTQAQLFETRSTRFSGDKILQKLLDSGNARQIAVRDSVLQAHAGQLAFNEVIETYYDDHHLGLVIFRNAKPHDLIGFWDPEGKPVDGGKLVGGSGEVQTPFNPAIVKNFKNESVVYANGVKNGPVFYFCDCAKVLRRGAFVANQKSGLWKEFSPEGKFIRQEELELPPPPDEDAIKVTDPDWLQPAHCMMRKDEECPDFLKGGGQ